MANATIKSKIISYTLELDEDEARTLVQLCDCVGGDKHMSARRHTEEIRRALAAAGVESAKHRLGNPDSVFFAD